MYKNHHKGLQERKLNITGTVVAGIHLGVRTWNYWAKLKSELTEQKSPRLHSVALSIVENSVILWV